LVRLFEITEEMLGDYNQIANQLNTYALEPLINRFNGSYARENLYHLSSETQHLSKREMSAIRSRVGLLVEYAIISILHETVDQDTSGRCKVTFNTTNTFADFFIRDKPGDQIAFRIDVKAFQSASAEKSARFDTIERDIDKARDFLFVARWDWKREKLDNIEIEYPIIMDAVFVSCAQFAKERDFKRINNGGGFDSNGLPLASTGKPDTNFGKMHRLVDETRLDSLDLDPWVRKLQEMA